MMATTTSRPWLDRLKHHLGTTVEPGEKVSKDLTALTDKTDNTHPPSSFVGFVGESQEVQEAEIAWRVEALRPHVARIGPLDPVRLPPVREGVPPLCRQDATTGDISYGRHCASCGEPREVGQLFHCRACQLAHHRVLLEIREGVPIAGTTPPTHESREVA